MLMLPDSLEWVLEMLGFQWPTADEDKLLECAQVWRQFAADITEIQVQGVSSAGNVLGENYGDSIEGFRSTWEKFSGGSGYLDDARSAAEMIAFTFEAAAMLVIGMKLAVIAQLIILACEIIAAQAAAPFTLGLSELGALGATAATRMIVRQIIKECAQQLLQAVIETAKEPFVSALQAMISDVIAQTVNQNFGAQSGYDLGRTAKTGLDEGVNAAKNSANTFGESLRDGAAGKAGHRARQGIDSAAGHGSDGGSDGSDSSSGSRSSSSGSSSSDGSPSPSSTSSGSSSDSGSGSGSGNNFTSSSDSSSTAASSGGRSPDGAGLISTSDSPASNDGGEPSPSRWADPAQRPTDTTGQNYAPSPFDAAPSRQDGGGTEPAAGSSSTPDGGERHSTPGENIPGGTEPSRADSDAPRSTVGDDAATPQSDGPATHQNAPGDQGPPRSDDSGNTDASPPADASASTERSAGPEDRAAPESHRVDGSASSEGAPIAHDRPGPGPTTPDPSPSPSPDPVSPVDTTPGDTTPAAEAHTGTPVSPGPGADPVQNEDDNTARTGGSRPSMPNATMPHGGPERSHTGSYGPQPGPAHTADPEDEGMALQGSATATAPPPTTTPADTGPAQHNPAPSAQQNAAPTTTPPAPGPVPHRTPQTAQPGPTSRPVTPRTDRPAPPRDGNIADVSRQTPTTRPYDPRLDGPRRDDAGTRTPGRIPPQRDGRDHSQPEPDPRNPNDSTDRERTRTGTPGQDRRPGTDPDHGQPEPDTPNPPDQGDPTPDNPDSTPEQPQDQQPDNEKDQPAEKADQPPGENLQTIRDGLDTHPGGLLPPAPHDQQALENAFPRNPDGTPQRFANPFEGWNQLQNDGGLNVWGRSNNCADCSRSFLESWYGNPTVSAPRTPDTNPDGSPDRTSPENDSVDNQQRWAGAPFTYNGDNIPMAAYQVAKGLWDAGHGSAALIAVSWPGGGGHAFNAVNWNGHIVWVDTQSGAVSKDFPYPQAEGIWSIPLDANRQPIPPAQPQTTDNQQNQNAQTETQHNNSSQHTDHTQQSSPAADPTAADTAADTAAPTAQAAPPETSGTPDRQPPSTATDSPDPAQRREQADEASDTTVDAAPADTERPESDSDRVSDEGPADAADTAPTSDAGQPTVGAPGEPAFPSSDSRPYDVDPGGVQRPDPADQQALEDSLPRNPDGTPQRHPDPDEGTWVGNVNGQNPHDAGRANNCADAALSFADTYAGRPTAAAARTPDLTPDGTPSDRGETGGRDRIENTLGARFTDQGDGAEAFTRLETTLLNEGHGSQAVIITQDANGRAHAWNAVNHNGRISYIDPQTGQRSNTPLHAGDNGVFAIPLDADRRPIAADGAGEGVRPDSRAASRATTSPAVGGDRRPDQAPAGAKTDSASGHSGPPRGSSPYDQKQDADHTHYGVRGDKGQTDLREVGRDVQQMDLAPVHSYLLHLAENERSALADVLAGCKDGKTFKKADLMTALPGFKDLKHEGERLAVVAALGRLSVEFHRSHSVGVAVDNSRTQPYRWREDADVTRSPARNRDELRQRNDPKLMNVTQSRGVSLHESTDLDSTKPSGAKSAQPAQKAKKYLQDRYGEDAMDAALSALAEMKPDLTGRNYAAIEVLDKSNNEAHYVVDSSFSNDKLPRPSHSEPHLGGFIERLNEGQDGDGPPPDTDRYEILSMYTEREPCGTSQGHADCSGYIKHYVTSSAVTHYGTGYRKGDRTEEFDGQSDPRPQVLTPRDAMNADFQHHMNVLGDVFMRYAGKPPLITS
ncbi:toxin glutamine deamidase domain-containing protein [Streptomyces meridianus]|uniref:Toxin glutamine deamidase domain-containing protein n=1 Tax=Streptomyces meridianus TaxID=2938945 RepID=A0ABT0XDQ4_9ACTN|nr:toxin glutamine deamidase domain-containing protein [Streptomyces meridianus]MCM2579857.1 toxin glutamine deamidase domain-containing protein [Streptomyces meridianus]